MNKALHSAKCAAALISIAALLAACGDTQDAALDAPLRAVKVKRVERTGGTNVRTFSGTVSSTKETSLSFRVSGRVIAKDVSVADRVSAGDVLAKLDPAPFELEVQRSLASLAEAQANARNAKSSYERTKRLYEAGNSSRESLDNARTSLNSAEAQERSISKALELARLDLGYSQLVAEDSCAIAKTDLQVGENIQQGQQVILANCGDSLEVDLGIPELFIARVEQGAAVDVSFPALPDVRMQGTVDDVGIAATSGGTTFPVTVALPGDASRLVKSGLSAQVTFRFASASNGDTPAKNLVVPSFAVGEDQVGRFVYTVETTSTGNATVKRIAVRVGDLSDEGIEILSGVDEGALIVTAGVSALRDGLEVALPNE
ncbi:MAG: efflux RND transporter periplasmic adaptor subunit [Pseudomonadota bacterium]